MNYPLQIATLLLMEFARPCSRGLIVTLYASLSEESLPQSFLFMPAWEKELNEQLTEQGYD